ncbi:hypothetical protein [Methylobacterium brachiatum]|uniref:hypothetical protein n=1 Tax=Methylobacterium brachiatum TaxID=269660 RepID=UPI000EFC097B|nr:hypothetical protein [Methylobacterium brachiatum]AYO83562.1 hypothetical protein EBB05_15665 [Methylobacterium brachiatum]
MLTVSGASSPIAVLSGDPDGALTIDLPTGTVSWNYTTAQSAGIPASGATYQLHRLIARSRPMRSTSRRFSRCWQACRGTELSA